MHGRLRNWVLLLLAAGITARLGRYLLQFPIWGDEAFICLNLRARDFLDLTRPLCFDQVAPIGFLWLEKLSWLCLGESELSLRLPALLAGILALVLFVPVAFRLLPARAAAVAIGLLAVSYYPVRHACEVKPYAFDLLVSVVFLGLAVTGRFRLLVLLTPILLACSYPAVFVAGAVLCVLPVHTPLTPYHSPHCTGAERRSVSSPCLNNPLSPDLSPARAGAAGEKGKRTALLFAAVLGLSFLTLFLTIGRGQQQSMVDNSGGFWDRSFPPANPGELPGWLWTTHAGNLLAYPAGGPNGGSAATLALCLLGAVTLRRRAALVLCLVPFLLTFLAAVLHKYPYGGSARVAQHLAPAICLLTAQGLATLAAGLRLCWKRRLRHLACLLLVVFAVGGLVRDCLRPTKTLGDRQVRDFARRTLAEAAGQPVIILQAPARLYPTFAWYLAEALWRASLHDHRGPATVIRFGTVAQPRGQTLSWSGRTLLSRWEMTFDLGPQADATRWAEVTRWDTPPSAE